jgi:hypothetical protein
MSDVALQRALADACLREDAGAELLRDPVAFLRAHEVPKEDIDALGDGARRFALYRALVRNNLTDVTENLLPATRARLGERFDRDFAAFLAERGPGSPYLRDVPFEFLDWVSPRWQADPSVPRWALDSARHELATFAVGASPTVAEPSTLVDLALDRPVALAGALRLLALGWAVHSPFTDAPEERAVHLLVHRDDAFVVRVLELTPLAFALMEALVAGAALQAAMVAACTKTGHVLDDETLASIARLLADFGERGLILGALP